ncbi:MAG: phosphoribosylamine--glycine ligase [Synergistaceae bacterium]|jgi:phosphoribosylamine--glycine ligase|nr:phosphoribosylamine--glycine ligase [Synergistaceae bacterium]
MNVLIIGSGGREHALAWKLSQSPKVTALFAAPGNPGIEKIARLVPLRTSDGEFGEIVGFALKESVGLVVVGPEAPLALGLADRLTERGIPCFGPGAKGARLESSKIYARNFMKRHGIPSPDWRSFSEPGEAKRYLETLPDAPVVVKAGGLAQGKGVVVAANRAEALSAVDETMGGRFGEAGREILIEECLTGEEVSLLTFTDGKTILPMLPVQDHKRIGDGDTGPNTGGMGTYAPVSVFSEEVARTVDDAILRPLEAALRTEGLDYRGCLYVGLMLTPDGPRVIEFNARFGDPETQVLMPLLESDLFDILYACAVGRLEKADAPKWSGGSAVCVVMASRGYPGAYATGQVITEKKPVPEALARDSWVFHAGTARDAQGNLTTAGGRVLGVTARGKTLEEAIGRAYARVDSIDFQGRTFRRDIAYRELARRR